MSYYQPENSNRVNSIKQKFEQSPSSSSSETKKCPKEEKKEQLRRTLSSSPVEPKRNLKLNVTRQLSNPNRNIKRTPAFRGDKLIRTKNLISPTKEKVVSIVDKNVKLFEDKPEYGKLGNVKKKTSIPNHTPVDKFGVPYDRVSSAEHSENLIPEFDARSQNTTGYGKISCRESVEPKTRRSQTSGLSLNIQTPCRRNDSGDSVKTTVISRQKNISPIYSTADELDAVYGCLTSNSASDTQTPETHRNPLRLDKFFQNGVEYTKVMKVKPKSHSEKNTEKDLPEDISTDERTTVPDVREELSRRKYEPAERKANTPYGRRRRMAERPHNISQDRKFHEALSDGEGDSIEREDDVIHVKGSFRRENLSRKSSSFSNVEEILGVKLTDTLKAALKAPLPPGPPPKKPPRTFAHSPVMNRSPVDDYEQVNGFWQKIKTPAIDSAPNPPGDNDGQKSFLYSITKVAATQPETVPSNPPDDCKKNSSSFLHGSASKPFRRSLRDRNRLVVDGLANLSETDVNPEQLEAQHENSKVQSRIKIFEKKTLDSENPTEHSSLDYESMITNISDSSSSSPTKSTSPLRLGIGNDSTEDDNSMRRNGNLSSTQVFNESTSSEDNSSSLQNVSYSPQKFKSSPTRCADTAKCRTSKDSKKMLERLENVLVQHQRALGPKVIMARSDKLVFGTGSNSRTESECDSESESARNKEDSQKRLSRTLEDTKKLGPLPQIPVTAGVKISTFDCLPSLNCASSSLYEQIQSPNFKTYLVDSKNNSLERSQNFYSKSGESPMKSNFYLDSSKRNSLKFEDNTHYDSFIINSVPNRLSTEFSTFLDGRKLQSDPSKTQEHVYAEPFAFDKSAGTDILGSAKWQSGKLENFRGNELKDNSKNAKEDSELHYMCSPVPSAFVGSNCKESKNELSDSKKRQQNVIPRRPFLKLANLARPSPDNFNKTKIEQLLDQAFGQPVMAGAETPTDSNTSSDTDSLASSQSNSDELYNFTEKLQLFKDKEKSHLASKEDVHRSLTERRKHYVRRVSSKFSERREGLVIDRRDKLFEVCLLVELNLSTKKPYVKDKYPIYATTPEWIENFCFPDASDWPPSDSDQNQSYSLVLTDEKGNRRYGYCCRVKPEGAPVCLPLAYCLISKHRASGFYNKVLHELEARHGLPDAQRRRFIEEVYNSAMPRPGHALRLKPDVDEAFSEPDCSSNNNVVEHSFTNSYGKTYSVAPVASETNSRLLSSEMLNAERERVDLEELGVMDDSIIRLDDHRLEERDMSQLFDAVSTKVLLLLFGSLLLERKVVLVCNKLSKLSSCVEALQSLLYPFNWLHTFIPVLPNVPGLPEILQAPLPFVIGILKSKNGFGIEMTAFEDGIVVDLDTSKVLFAVGDESSILPSRLQKGLKSALQVVSSNTRTGDGVRNFLVSEAFLRVFVETCAHCNSHIVTQQDGKVLFEKESFVKAIPSRGMQYFLEWFVETTMFNQFIEDRILTVEGSRSIGETHMKLFNIRVAEYLENAGKHAQSKKGHSKKKTFGDRLKDLTTFN